MTNLEKLNQNYPELVAEYSKMDKEELLEQICAEVIDLHNMVERVQVFMDQCTLNYSDTTYTIDSIRTMINEKQERDINEFCSDLFKDYETNEDIIQDLKERANNI